MKIKFLLLGLLFCLSLCFLNKLDAQTVLPLNGSVTGVTSAAGDTTLYSLTTNADGEINLTLTVSNNQATWAAIYDSDRVTLLTRNYTYTGPLIVSQDGLAKGKYYVKIYPYYNSGTPNFTISNTLTVPAEANDNEPNDSRAQAETLLLDDSTKGHVGYYYNIHRDTADWYKVTTNADGMLSLRLRVANNTAVWCTLYDNDGTTILANNYTYTNQVVNTDGLASGTYYLKLTCYYNGQFAPYTLADSLFTYNANDTAPNSYPYQATTLPANGTVTGHVGFYYNNTRDTLDFWKINYTGSGNLNFTFNLIPHNVDGKISPVWFQVYNDTTKALFSANYYSAASSNISFTGLPQGYYYIRIVPYYYNSDFNAYSITNSFTQVNVAAASLLKSVSHNACGTDSLIYGLSGSHSPYTVRLYRNGALYDSLTTVSDSAVFGALNDGNYYATVFGDGATGEAFGKSAVTQFLPPTPAGLNTTKISTTSAQLNWSAIGCVKNYQLQYMITGGSNWTTINTTISTTYNLTGLTMDTTYSWRVASIDTVNSIALESVFSAAMQFTTLADTARIAFVSVTPVNDCSNTSKLQYQISHSEPPYSVQLYRFGVAYGSPMIVNDNNPFTISNLPAGIYYTTVFGDNVPGAIGTSTSSTILPPTPAGLTSSKISTTSAQLNWNPLSCVKNYQLQYMISGGSTWTTINTATNNTYNLTELTMDTTYSWRVESVDTVNSMALESAYSAAMQFTTLADTARIAFVSVTPVNDCSNTSKLQYQISHSKPPYSVQLYRFGAAYGNPVIVNDKNAFTISNLPAGIYYASAYGNKDAGALGYSNSATILPPIPTALSATKVMDHSATLNWSMLSCTNYDTLEYRANDSATWKILVTSDNSGVYKLANLAGNVTYLFRVESVIVVNGQKLASGFSSTFTFTTLIDLPVTLVNFTATANNGVATLNWSTATELNNKGFEIFRSADGTNCTSIGFVSGAGNSDLLLNYQFTDKPGISGNVFYRLKQVDLDGNFAWSNVVHVTMNGNQLITFLPNPAKGFITISSSVTVKEVRLLAVSGQVIKVWQNVSPNAQLDLGTIASGTYLIQFLNDQSSQTMKLVKSN